jgi:hypothetical protein
MVLGTECTTKTICINAVDKILLIILKGIGTLMTRIKPMFTDFIQQYEIFPF